MSNGTRTSDKSTTSDQKNGAGRFGVFGGVFTPSILTILGVIMYMRAGFVTGQAGILAALAMLVLSKAITFLTGLSISAISTNTRVKGGGAYFLISRSLGPEFGGAIGLTLFIAQALSAPFYILGFTEALCVGFPELQKYTFEIGVLIATLLFIINYIGSSAAIKAQFFILAVMGLSILVMLGGAIFHFDPDLMNTNMQPAYTAHHNFWSVFAIFFPAVTGIMSGVNMSGDLKDPARSIPAGTLWAIGVGFIIYFLQIVLTGSAQTRSMLTEAPYGSLLEQALFNLDFLVIAGVYAATLSSALASLMGAPRILQALARDGIFPPLKIFGRGAPGSDEPRRGLWLTYIMTVITLKGAGGGGQALNIVAGVLTMFFLYTYGMTNLAAFIESFGGNPSFRPQFRFFHWSAALLGAIGCFAATLLIDATSSLVAALIIFALFWDTRRRLLTSTFGDARRGFYYSMVRKNLNRLRTLAPDPKNWRPTTLTLSGNPLSRLTLTTYATLLDNGRGIVTLAEIVVGDFHELIRSRRNSLRRLRKFIDENSLNAFPEVLVSESLDTGMSSLLQAHSIGPIKPNLLMVGWSGDKTRIAAFTDTLRLAEELDISQVILQDRGLPGPGRDKRIDIWWRGQRNGSLMLILAYLLKSNWAWTRSRIRILRILKDNKLHDKAYKELEELAHAARIPAELLIVSSESSIKETIAEYSSDATLVLLGFAPPPREASEEFHHRFEEITADLPTTMLVWSNGEADLLA